MDGARMFELAQALAIAKSRQDVSAALKLFDADMVLESPAFGTRARGLKANTEVLTRFFESFPDYNVVLHGHADNGDTLICWGLVQKTMTGDRFGAAPSGRRADMQVFIQCTFKNDLIASERFFFDVSALCSQSSVSSDVVCRKRLGAESPSAPEWQP